jgi:hypothetical protein
MKTFFYSNAQVVKKALIEKVKPPNYPIWVVFGGYASKIFSFVPLLRKRESILGIDRIETV